MDYLAFYQTGAFGEANRWRIEYLAEVLGHELTTRLRLFSDEPDHPRAKEEYYRISIGPLIHLPQPILAGRWRRVTFLYTTGAYLRNAREINDLVVHSEERQILWRSLRERALQSGQYQATDLPEMQIDPVVLEMLGAMVFKIGEETDSYDEA